MCNQPKFDGTLAEQMKNYGTDLKRTCARFCLLISNHAHAYGLTMAFSRYFCPDYDFVFTQFVGIVDDESLRIHLLCYEIESKKMNIIKKLVDLRGVTKADKVTVQGLIKLADLDKKISVGREESLAIITNQPLFSNMARLYCDLIMEAKNDIGIFDYEYKALKWLGYNNQHADILSKFINKHRAGSYVTRQEG